MVGNVSAAGGDSLPRLRDELKLYPGPRGVDGAPSWTLHDPVRQRFFRIGWREFEMLSRWHLGKAEDLLAGTNSDTALNVSEECLKELLQFLFVNQLLRTEGKAGCEFLDKAAKQTDQSLSKRLLHNYLFFRVPLVRPDRFLAKTLPYLSYLFSHSFFLLTIGAGLLGLFLAARQWDVFVTTFLHFFSLSGLAFYAIALLFTKLVHELGHAYAAKRYGLHIPTMGVAFLVMWPVLYTDTTDAWKLPSYKQRQAIAAAGMAAELTMACYATLIWSFLPEGAAKSAFFLIATATWMASLLININPFMRFDGYYLLSDTWRIPNLQDRSFLLGRWWLRRVVLGVEQAPPEEFSHRLQRLMIVYAYSTWIYRLLLFLGIALLVYFFFFKLLGIFLMLVELTWFIGRPIYKELQQWSQMREVIVSTGRSRVSLLIVIGMIGLFIVPWNSNIEAPALLKAKDYTYIYPQLPGLLSEVHIQAGQSVHAGDTLFILSSPELDYQISQSRIQISALEIQLSRRAADRTLLSQSRVLDQKLAEFMTIYQGLLKQRDRLNIKAPITGVVVEMADGLFPGRWLNERERLIMLVKPDTAVIEAYLPEEMVGSVKPGSNGHFYRELEAQAPVEAELVSIDRVETRVLKEAYLASTYGGQLPASWNKQGKLIVHEAYYRLQFKPITALAAPDRVIRGNVILIGEPGSLLGRLWQYVAAVVIRESGF